MIALYRPTGQERMEWFKKTASALFNFSDLVYIASSGYIAQSTATSAPNLGLIYRQVKATDTDYAQNTRVPVLIPNKDTVFICDVGTGSAGTTTVGLFRDLAATAPYANIDVTADTYGVFEVIDVISATQVLAKLAIKGGAAAG